MSVFFFFEICDDTIEQYQTSIEISQINEQNIGQGTWAYSIQMQIVVSIEGEWERDAFVPGYPILAMPLGASNDVCCRTISLHSAPRQKNVKVGLMYVDALLM